MIFRQFGWREAIRMLLSFSNDTTNIDDINTI